MLDLEKLETANKILSLLVADRSQFRTSGNRLYFCWQTPSGENIQREWKTTPRQDAWPIFWRQWGHGGTCCYALCQLARWIQGREVLPFSAWENWLSPNVMIVKGNQAAISALLVNWPRSVNCIKCNQPINGRFDWYGHGKKSGCGHLRCD